MPDASFYNHPFNQYVFTSSEMKKALLRKQGRDEWSSSKTGEPHSYGFSKGFYSYSVPPRPSTPLTNSFVYP